MVISLNQTLATQLQNVYMTQYKRWKQLFYNLSKKKKQDLLYTLTKVVL